MAPRWLRRTQHISVAAAIGLALSACGLAVAPATLGPTPASSTQSGPPSGMHVVFSDNFAGSTLDTSKWDTCYWWADTGSGCSIFGSNNEQEWYLPSQDQVSGGALHLVASKTPTNGVDVNGQPKVYPWRSGIVTTFNSLNFTYGYAQVTARVPQGDGLWPTLWLLPQSKAWPPEIDFQESNGSNTHVMYSTLHPVGGGQHQYTYTSPTDLSAGWHTYAVDWEPGSLTFSVDGATIGQYVGSDVPSQPMYFLANLAVNGSPTWQAVTDASTPSTASLDIQSVQIYQR